MSWWSRLMGRGDGMTRSGPPKKVSAEVAAEMQRGGAVLLDVREQAEWSAGRAPRARHIPLDQLDARAARELSSTATVLTICRSGARSARAATQLRRAGYTAVNVKGGMHAWQQAGLPVTASGGRPGRVT